jgi:hypothetical protein
MSARDFIRVAGGKISTWYRESKSLQVGAGVILDLVPVTLAHTAFLVFFSSPDDHQVVSGIIAARLGEYHCEDLQGSKICVNSNSAIHYLLTRSTRNFEVLQGDASIVARKEKRPLDVMVKGLLIHDYSTAFNVSIAPNSVRVTTTEGTVGLVAHVDSETRLKFIRGEALEPATWKTAPKFRRFQRAEFDVTTQQLTQLPDATELELRQLQASEEGRILLNGRTVDGTIHELRKSMDLPQFDYPPSVGNIPLAGDIVFNDLNGFLEALKIKDIYHFEKKINSQTVIFLRIQDKTMTGAHARRPTRPH